MSELFLTVRVSTDAGEMARSLLQQRVYDAVNRALADFPTPEGRSLTWTFPTSGTSLESVA